MNISDLRQRNAYGLAADRAILDLLELQELGMAPGILTTAQLRTLWRCSQSMVSRRLHAIDRLGTWQLRPNMSIEGSYWLAPRLKPAAPMPPSGPRRRRYQPLPDAAKRWEKVRQRWGVTA